MSCFKYDLTDFENQIPHDNTNVQVVGIFVSCGMYIFIHLLACMQVFQLLSQNDATIYEQH